MAHKIDTDSNPLYPVFLKLDNKSVLIVGGGLVALQKIKGLLNTQAKITVIAPEIRDELKAARGVFPDIRYINFVEEQYIFGYEKDFDLVIAATDDIQLNNAIAMRCRDQMIMVNSVDEPEFCDFYVPSIIQADAIKIAISTNGKSPSVARKLREELTVYIQQRYSGVIDTIHNFRVAVKNKIQGEDLFPRRLKLINWFTDRLFKERRRVKIKESLMKAKYKNISENPLLKHDTSNPNFKKQYSAKLTLLGAGPGAADLITVRGMRSLLASDVVLYDNLISEDVISMLDEQQIEKIYVGKTREVKHKNQDEINQLIKEHLLLGKHVLRLKGGDPFIFARGLEEVQIAIALNCDYEIIPGLTSSLAGASLTATPITLRKQSHSIYLVTGHELDSKHAEFDLWVSLLHSGTNLCIYMAVFNIDLIAETLIQKIPNPTEVRFKIIMNISYDNQQVFEGDLSNLQVVCKTNQIKSPAIIYLGKFL